MTLVKDKNSKVRRILNNRYSAICSKVVVGRGN